MLSIIIPTLNEAGGIAAALAPLADLRARGCEVVVVDGGSTDDTPRRAGPGCDRVLAASRGRALQMNAGARAARGDRLLFLHADTRLPGDADRLVAAALDGGRRLWGRFDVTIDGPSVWFGVIGAMMNLRSRLTGIATGDQAIFCTRAAFVSAGGFPEIPLMEDIAFSRLMLRQSRPACLRERVVTSGRRWERGGILRTVLLMWRLRLGYFLGADPQRLARRYEDVRRTGGS